MCMLDSADGQVTPLGDPERPVAKAAHRCAECRRVIEPGERYLRERYMWDGEFTLHKTCAHCEVARDWLWKECGGWLYGSIEEDIREHCFGHGYGMGLYRLAVGMAWKWRTPRGRLLPVPAVPPTGHEIAAAARGR